MSLSPLVFTGISKFSEDLRTILDRAVSIAKLPITGLQNDQVTLLSKKQQLTDLKATLDEFTSAMTRLANLGATRAMGASSSNTDLVSVQSSSTRTPGMYTISEITSLARAASETTVSGWSSPDADPVTGDGIVELVYGTQTYTISLDSTQNNLNGLRDAINNLGVGLNATVLNTGVGSNPYYLSIAASATGQTVLQLRATPGDENSNLLTNSNQGANAVFKLNGLTVEKPSNQIQDVVPGVAFTLKNVTQPGQYVTLSVASSSGQLFTALSDFATKYNDLRQKLSAQVGENAGALSGDYVVRELQAALRQVVNYEGAGTVRRISDLGLVMDSEGNMSFDTNVFYSLSAEQLAGAFDFLGSSSTGFGALTSRFSQFTDPYTGLIQAQQRNYDEADRRISAQIETIQQRVTLLQTSLSARLQQVDSLLARLESQQTLLDATVQSLNYVIYGRQEK